MLKVKIAKRLKVSCMCREKILEPCPQELCDGTGVIRELVDDEMEVSKCPCQEEMGDEELQEQEEQK